MKKVVLLITMLLTALMGCKSGYTRYEYELSKLKPKQDIYYNDAQTEGLGVLIRNDLPGQIFYGFEINQPDVWCDDFRLMQSQTFSLAEYSNEYLFKSSDTATINFIYYFGEEKKFRYKSIRVHKTDKPSQPPQIDPRPDWNKQKTWPVIKEADKREVDTKVKINAGKAIFLFNGKEFIFSKTPDIPEMKLRGNNFNVSFDKDNRITQVKADVIFLQIGERFATADLAIYDPKTGIMKLKGNVVIYKGKDRVVNISSVKFMSQKRLHVLSGPKPNYNNNPDWRKKLMEEHNF